MKTENVNGGFATLAALATSLPDKLANCHPKLARGQVWCHRCGHTRKVDSAGCFARGWPLCCGETMSIDSPEERAALRARSASPERSEGTPNSEAPHED